MTMPAARIVSMMLLALVLSSAALADDVSTPTIYDAIEGTWVLEEWNVDGEKLAPPEATGRLSLHNGVIMIVLGRSTSGSTKTYLGFGTYAISGSTWSYGYERYTVVEETPSKVTVDHGLPWAGLRPFQVSAEGQKLVFEFEGYKAQIVISGDDFLYNERGTLVRKWKRVAN